MRASPMGTGRRPRLTREAETTMSSTPTSPSADVEATEEVAPSRDEPDPQLLRALADLDNLRKRYERRLAEAADEERRRVTSLWLPIVDDLERALDHVDDDAGAMSAGAMSAGAMSAGAMSAGAMSEGLRAVYDE